MYKVQFLESLKMDLIKNIFKNKYNVSLLPYEIFNSEIISSTSSQIGGLKDLIFQKSDGGIKIFFTATTMWYVIEILLIFTCDSFDGYENLVLQKANKTLRLQCNQGNLEKKAYEELIKQIVLFFENEQEILWKLNEDQQNEFLMHIIYIVSPTHDDDYYFYQERQRRNSTN